jgi:hypothetical protein
MPREVSSLLMAASFQAVAQDQLIERRLFGQQNACR